jgi:hypothetical protein
MRNEPGRPNRCLRSGGSLHRTDRYPPSSVLEGEYLAATGRPESLAFSNSAQVRAGERSDYFYTPNEQASYTESVQQIVPALSNTQSAYMSPSDDGSNDSDYEWQANGVDGVQPTFKAVDLDAADSQSEAAFYSGIAFGVAGSAAIALIQEIPAERRKRKSSGSGPPRQPAS